MACLRATLGDSGRVLASGAFDPAVTGSSKQSSGNGKEMIPNEIHERPYILLTTFRRSGVAVPTPLWFAERDGKLYVKTRNDSGKFKRIRNNPSVRVAPCTMRGKVTGPEFAGIARVLPAEQWGQAQEAINRKYWLARLPFWSKKNEFLEIEIAA